MERVQLGIDELTGLARRILTAHRTSEANAAVVADALVAAEVDGQVGHGASRLPSYCAQSGSGKVDGYAEPAIERAGPSALRVDARNGFAYPALRLALAELAPLARETGIAAASVTHSHHTGVMGHHVEALAGQGLVALAVCNGPQGIAPWGGTRGVFGTNPIAFAAPREDGQHLVIDMSLSKVARGKINVAAQQGQSIPEGWAVDAEGRPTTDPKAALAGTLLPMGDAKGAQLVLMVEILAGAVSASNFGYEASSFFSGEGDAPNAGQLIIAIDPRPFSGGGFAARLEDLIATILGQPGTRLPGSGRFERRRRAATEGISLPAALHGDLERLSRGESGD